MRGELGLDAHAEETSLFPWLVFWASLQFEFTYVKWNNRQMDFANVSSRNIVRSRLQNWKFAYRCGLLLHNCNNKKMGLCITFSRIKKKKKFDSSALVYICLHSITESSTLVYTRLVARLHSFSDLSTVVYICLWLVYIRLVTCLCFLW